MQKELSAIIFFLTLLTGVGNAQDKYFIVFCGNEGIPGHAFVVFGRESYSDQMSIVDGAWGLHPASGKEGGKSFIIGEVPGAIREEGIGKKCDFNVVREVSQSEYSNGLDIKKQWASKGKYELTKSDCVSFLIAVAQTVKSLKIPTRAGLDNFPAKYVQSLSNNNE